MERVTASRMVEAVTVATGMPGRRIERLARTFLDTRVWTPSRGRAVARYDACEVVRLIAAAAFVDVSPDAPEMGERFMALRARVEGDGPEIGEVFGGLLGKVPMTLHLHLSASGLASAMIECHGEVPAALHFWTEPTWGAFSRRTFEMSPEGVEVLANTLQNPERSGEALEA